MEGGGEGCRQCSGEILKKQTLSQLPQAVESSSELRRGEPQVRKINRARQIKNNVFVMKARANRKV